jgi:glycosyltransferase involved in cell wall biosynthesis
MKILFIINSMSFGGAEKQALDLLIGLKNRGIQIHLVTLIMPTAFIHELKINKINYSCINLTQKNKKNILSHYSAFLNLYHIVKKFQPEIIHSHLFHSNMYGRVVSLFLKTKNISTIHSLIENGNFRPILYRYTDWLCSKTVFVSDVSRLKYLKNKSVKEGKCYTINNGFDLSRKNIKDSTDISSLRQKHSFGVDNFIWISIGRLISTKGYLLLLESFLLLYNANDRARLVIVGDGEDKEMINCFIVNNALEKIVILLSPTPDIDQVYLLADAYISTSKVESFGMTLVEAIMFNLPIVSTMNGGAEELLLNKNIGLLTADRRPSSIVQLMVETMNEKTKNSPDSYRNLLNLYDIEKIVERWIDLYLKTLRT